MVTSFKCSFLPYSASTPFPPLRNRGVFHKPGFSENSEFLNPELRKLFCFRFSVSGSKLPSIYLSSRESVYTLKKKCINSNAVAMKYISFWWVKVYLYIIQEPFPGLENGILHSHVFFCSFNNLWSWCVKRQKRKKKTCLTVQITKDLTVFQILKWLTG